MIPLSCSAEKNVFANKWIYWSLHEDVEASRSIPPPPCPYLFHPPTVLFSPISWIPIYFARSIYDERVSRYQSREACNIPEALPERGNNCQISLVPGGTRYGVLIMTIPIGEAALTRTERSLFSPSGAPDLLYSNSFACKVHFPSTEGL